MFIKNFHDEKYIYYDTCVVFGKTECYLQPIGPFKDSTTTHLTVRNYSFKDLISYFIPYIRIKMSCSLDVCQPNPSTFSINYFVRLIINYFGIPHNFILITVRKKTPVNRFNKIVDYTPIKEIIKIFVLVNIYCILSNSSSMKEIQWYLTTRSTPPILVIMI